MARGKEIIPAVQPLYRSRTRVHDWTQVGPPPRITLHILVLVSIPLVLAFFNPASDPPHFRLTYPKTHTCSTHGRSVQQQKKGCATSTQSTQPSAATTTTFSSPSAAQTHHYSPAPIVTLLSPARLVGMAVLNALRMAFAQDVI